MFVLGESLGQCIGGLSIGWDVVEADLLLLDFKVQEMVTDLDVLRVIMKLGVLSNCNGRLVVDAKGGRGRGVLE